MKYPAERNHKHVGVWRGVTMSKILHAIGHVCAAQCCAQLTRVQRAVAVTAALPQSTSSVVAGTGT